MTEEERQKQKELDERLFSDDLKFVMEHRRGRAFIWRLLALCGKGVQPITFDPMSTGFNCGKLDISFQIEALCEPDYFLTMMKEAKEHHYDRPSDTAPVIERNPLDDA